MIDLKYWLAFSKLGLSGGKLIRVLWEHFGSMKEAWFASNADILEIEELKYANEDIKCARIQKFIDSRKTIDPDEVLEDIQKRNLTVVTLADENYPYLLKQIHNPPAVFYVSGDLESCNLNRTLAVVGSRKASHYIIEILNRLIGEFRGTDIAIVSGMALGVDSCAHNAAIKNNLKTIAVLGSGFDFIYPKSNKDLFKKISEGNGAVISEYYPSEEPETWKFPARNRIISGFSKGTLIAEAGLKSGALITARLCLEQNRELMCIPGLVTNPNTSGVHKLMQDGAGVVTNSKDILNYLNWHYDEDLDNSQQNFNIDLLDNEKKVYEILSLEPMQFDEILQQSRLSAQELMVVVTSLELSGIIKQLPGQKYIKSLLN